MPQSSRHHALCAFVVLGLFFAAPLTLRAADVVANPNQRTYSIDQQSDAAPASEDTANPTAPRSPAESDAAAELPASEQLPLGESAPGAPEGRETQSKNDNSVISGSGSWIFDTITALGVVIGLILLMRWLYLKISGQPSTTRTAASVVEVLSRTTVAPRNHVLLLRVGHRILIVGDSGSGMRTLANIDDEHEVADLLASVSAAQPNSVTKNFSQLLSRFGAAHDPVDPDAPNATATWVSPDEDGGDDAEHVFDRARHNVSGLTSRIRSLADKRKGGGL